MDSVIFDFTDNWDPHDATKMRTESDAMSWLQWFVLLPLALFMWAALFICVYEQAHQLYEWRRDVKEWHYDIVAHREGGMDEDVFDDRASRASKRAASSLRPAGAAAGEGVSQRGGERLSARASRSSRVSKGSEVGVAGVRSRRSRASAAHDGRVVSAR